MSFHVSCLSNGNEKSGAANYHMQSIRSPPSPSPPSFVAKVPVTVVDASQMSITRVRADLRGNTPYLFTCIYTDHSMTQNFSRWIRSSLYWLVSIREGIGREASGNKQNCLIVRGTSSLQMTFQYKYKCIFQISVYFFFFFFLLPDTGHWVVH